MNEWTTLIRQAVSIFLLLLLLGVLSFIVFVSNYHGSKQVESFAAKVSYDDYSRYDGMVVDKPAARNILRSNKDRLPVYLGTSTTQISEDPSVAHTQINTFLDTSAKLYVVSLIKESDGMVVGMRVKVK
jgi:hypothetical protein